MKTLSYIKGKQREIVKGEDYYLGELWDGNGEVDSILCEDGKGTAWVLNTVDDIPLFVDFTYSAVNMDSVLDTIVTVTDAH
jgi:hypothetical protein